MKKLICIFLLILTGMTAFAGDFSLSVGAGGLLGGLFTRYTMDLNDGGNPAVLKQEANQFDWGFFAFLDATYGIFSVSSRNGANNWKQAVSIPSDGIDSDADGLGWENMLSISLFGKYPFKLDDKLTVFPLFGVEYQISLRQHRTDPDGYVYSRDDGVFEQHKDGEAFIMSDWNSLFIKIGGGLDLELSRNFYLRFELLYAFRLMTPYEQKNLEYMKSMTGDSNPKLGGLTSGPSINIGVGYRFLNWN